MNLDGFHIASWRYSAIKSHVTVICRLFGTINFFSTCHILVRLYRCCLSGKISNGVLDSDAAFSVKAQLVSQYQGSRHLMSSTWIAFSFPSLRAFSHNNLSRFGFASEACHDGIFEGCDFSICHFL